MDAIVKHSNFIVDIFSECLSIPSSRNDSEIGDIGLENAHIPLDP